MSDQCLLNSHFISIQYNPYIDDLNKHHEYVLHSFSVQLNNQITLLDDQAIIEHDQVIGKPWFGGMLHTYLKRKVGVEYITTGTSHG